MATITWLNRYQIHIPDQLTQLANWDVYDYWEIDRTHALMNRLQPSSTYIEVGAEHGWMSVPIAQKVGPSAVTLVEPSPNIWPNIRAIWEANSLQPPAHSYVGFANEVISQSFGTGLSQPSTWPDSSTGPLIDAMSYHYLHEPDHARNVPSTTLDSLCETTSISPTHISIDVEGAECRVVKGMRRLLVSDRPTIFISLHPDLMANHYSSTPDDIFAIFNQLDYSITHLATDHEQHYLMEPL